MPIPPSAIQYTAQHNTIQKETQQNIIMQNKTQQNTRIHNNTLQYITIQTKTIHYNSQQKMALDIRLLWLAALYIDVFNGQAVLHCNCGIVYLTHQNKKSSVWNV